MLKSYVWGGGGLLAHKILVTAESPNSSFLLWTWIWDFGLVNDVFYDIIFVVVVVVVDII